MASSFDGLLYMVGQIQFFFTEEFARFSLIWLRYWGAALTLMGTEGHCTGLFIGRSSDGQHKEKEGQRINSGINGNFRLGSHYRELKWR